MHKLLFLLCLPLTAMESNNNNSKNNYYKVSLMSKKARPGTIVEMLELNKEESINVVSSHKFNYKETRDNYIKGLLEGIVYVPEKKLLVITEAEKSFITGIAFNDDPESSDSQEIVFKPIGKLSQFGDAYVRRERAWTK